VNLVISVAAFLLLAPLVGGLIAGLDRILSARLQARIGPPLFQPFYDVLKLMEKQTMSVNSYQLYYVACFLVFVMVTGVIFFAGGDLLLVIFALTVAGVFLALGAYSPHSPYSKVGADRELLQMMSYEPMLLLTALGMYRVTHSFHVDVIAAYPEPLVKYLPAVFLGFVFILTIKLRKSPFDLSASHHAHQELVKGLTTDFSGSTLALLEIGHWYENVILLGFTYLFFAAFGVAWAVLGVVLVYVLEVLVDNVYARLTWKATLKSSWIVTGVLGVANLLAVVYLF
jgi:ech hydrogenase subunit B